MTTNNPLDDIDLIWDNPHKFGMPTFEEFCKDPDKWRQKEDEQFALADKGSSILKHYVTKQIYEIDGYRCRSLDEVDKIAKSQGYSLDQLEFSPVIIPDVGRKCKLLVRFRIRKNNNGGTLG
jgi:hypothetical protein